VKITSPNPPPELVAWYATILSFTPHGAGLDLGARTRRAATAKLKRPNMRPAHKAIRNAAERIARKKGLVKDKAATTRFVSALTAAIKIGDFDPELWQTILPRSEVYITATADSVIDPDPGPYAYRDDDNLPSIPTYHDGEADAGPARYHGATTTGIFRDDSLTWHRIVYDLYDQLDAANTTPTYLRLTGTIHATADKRGARPMLSFLIDFDYKKWSDIADFDPTPPLHDNLSDYWRFEVPTGAPPYYDVTQPFAMTLAMRPTPAELATGPIYSVAVSILPRPLYGRGYNNNTEVTITIDHTATLHQTLIAAYTDQPVAAFSIATQPPYVGEFRAFGAYPDGAYTSILSQPLADILAPGTFASDSFTIGLSTPPGVEWSDTILTIGEQKAIGFARTRSERLFIATSPNTFNEVTSAFDIDPNPEPAVIISGPYCTLSTGGQDHNAIINITFHVPSPTQHIRNN
jgi:hypothetical protein